MDLNKQKCRILDIRKRLNNNYDYTEIQQIPQVKEYKYLGIILDEKLNLNKQIEYIKNKTIKRDK